MIDRTPVGNLYVNRAITGAMVARQPFGGNRLSGTGTKAGGPGYLLQFVEPRVVTENTMRHGLVGLGVDPFSAERLELGAVVDARDQRHRAGDLLLAPGTSSDAACASRPSTPR